MTGRNRRQCRRRPGLPRCTGYGITAGDFGNRVVITDQGVNTLITIDGVNTVILFGVTGDGNNVITQSDFIFGP